jgi:GT2 family glycosyltransferase
MEADDVAGDSKNGAPQYTLGSDRTMNELDITPQVSIVIVSFNTRDLLRECLQCLERSAANICHEIIVVDNASSDGSADMIAFQYSRVRLIRSDVNLGFASANNRGFEIARGCYIVLLNSDAFLAPNALALSVEHMEDNSAAGLGGARLVGRDDSWQPAARMFPSPLNDLLMISGLAARYPRSHLLGRADRTWADPGQPATVDWVPGAFSIIRREALDRVGYFDERFFLYYEEVDLCRRIKEAGYEIWYWPDVKALHLGGESSKTISGLKVSSSGTQLTLWRMRSELLYYRKHHGVSGAWSAMLLENWWNRLRFIRNAWPADGQHQDKAMAAQQAIATMKQAWRETHAGTISPPRPW